MQLGRGSAVGDNVAGVDRRSVLTHLFQICLCFCVCDRACRQVHIQSGSIAPFDVAQTRNTLLAVRERAIASATEHAVSGLVPECVEAKDRLLAKAEVPYFESHGSSIEERLCRSDPGVAG